MALSAPRKSTIVRSVVHLAFAGLERTLPALGAWIAYRLWFRLPPGAPATGRADLALPDGQAFTVDLGGRTIRGRAWGEGPVVYLVHGWAGAAHQLTPFVGPLVAKGFRVIGFDGLSHGRSDAGAHGRRSSDAVELARSLDAVHARFGPAHAVVAHSMGTLSTVLALRLGWIRADRLVFIAPVTRVADFVRRIRAELGFGDRTQSRLEALAQARTGYAVADLDVPRLVGEVEPDHLLVVHDEGDRETPHAGSVRLVSGWETAQLHSTRGLGHRRILADEGVTAVVSRFVATARPGTSAPAGLVTSRD